jgi:hypothetical protein
LSLCGVRDKKDKITYGNSILGVHKVSLLEMFRQYDIKATFQLLDFYFFETKQELLVNIQK